MFHQGLDRNLILSRMLDQVKFRCASDTGGCADTAQIRGHLQEYTEHVNQLINAFADDTEGEFSWFQTAQRYCKTSIRSLTKLVY